MTLDLNQIEEILVLNEIEDIRLLKDEFEIEDETISFEIKVPLELKNFNFFIFYSDETENHFNVKGLAKDQINGSNFVSLCGIYLNTYNKELTLWIESTTISQEAIDFLANEYGHRFELIRFERDEEGDG